MRIARALAGCGIGSRRKCEEYVANGAVRVNGEVVRDLGRQVDIETDVIQFRKKVLIFRPHTYYLLNKPVGVVTTASDERSRTTVFNFLPRSLVRASRQPQSSRTRVFSVGRLDKDTSGLLLFTNDGNLAHRLMHPRYKVDKYYEVRLNRAFLEPDRLKILKGVRLADGIARVQKVHRQSARKVRVAIREGKKREIRRLFAKLNYKVVSLCRYSMGPLTIGRLQPGQGRFLTKDEVIDLKKKVR